MNNVLFSLKTRPPARCDVPMYTRIQRRTCKAVRDLPAKMKFNIQKEQIVALEGSSRKGT